MTSIQLNESLSKDWVVGLAYKIRDFNLFGAKAIVLLAKPRIPAKSRQALTLMPRTQKPQAQSRKTGVNHDLNSALDMSLQSRRPSPAIAGCVYHRHQVETQPSSSMMADYMHTLATAHSYGLLRYVNKYAVVVTAAIPQRRTIWFVYEAFVNPINCYLTVS